ncbi:membrane protein [Actinocatenispora thailandica]|uniref:Membrane protein n=1 Tax=Actinocatenispora thailandica TaxID=227318 RepID=A0A7R7DKT7_9ACTN|nr:membrane protein [Actinocatenispora thailandica]
MPPATPVRRWPRGLLPLVVAGALVLASHLAGVRIAGALHLGQTYPIAGSWRSAVTGWFLVPVVAAALAYWGWPLLVRRLRWRVLLAVSAVVAAGWSVALALVDGPKGLTAPLAPYQQYPHDVSRVTDLGSYLATFAGHVVDPANGPVWAVHVGGHPPGALGVFVLLDRLGLGGLGWAAALCIAGGALAVPSVLVLTRLYGGAGAGRRAALFVPLAPAALWIATSADALFAGVAAAGLCALAVAGARRRPPGGEVLAGGRLRQPGGEVLAGGRLRQPGADLLAAVGGLALGCCLFLSYGLSLLVLPAVAVVLFAPRRADRRAAGGRLSPDSDRPAGGRRLLARWARETLSPQRIRPLLIGAAMVLAVLVAARLAGFDWWHGLSLAAERTRTGARSAHPPTVWQDRPTWYFLFANPAALAVLLGPAAIAALGFLRRSRLLVLPAAAALAVLGAVLSDLSKGEVERIYLPFALLMLPLTAMLPIRRYGRLLLAVQLGWAVLIALTIETWW